MPGTGVGDSFASIGNALASGNAANRNLSSGDLDKASFWQGIDNMFTGNLDYARNMYASNTAYQRAAEDLSAAGLNAANAVGNPASSPSSHSGEGGKSLIGALASFATSLIGGAFKLSQQSMIKDMNSTLNADRLSNALDIANINNAAKLDAVSLKNKGNLDVAALKNQGGLDVKKLDSQTKLDIAKKYIDAGAESGRHRNSTAIKVAHIYADAKKPGAKETPAWYNNKKPKKGGNSSGGIVDISDLFR